MKPFLERGEARNYLIDLINNHLTQQLDESGTDGLYDLNDIQKMAKSITLLLNKKFNKEELSPIDDIQHIIELGKSIKYFSPIPFINQPPEILKEVKNILSYTRFFEQVHLGISEKNTFTNGDGYIQHDPENIKKIMKFCLQKGYELFPGLFEDFIQKEAQKNITIGTFDRRLIEPLVEKVTKYPDNHTSKPPIQYALELLVSRFYVINLQSAREYGQPFFVLHENKLNKNISLNPDFEAKKIMKVLTKKKLTNTHKKKKNIL